MQPEKAAIVSVFDAVASTYETGGVELYAVFGRRLVELVAPAPGERVLDVGCGTGAVTIPLAEAVGPSGHVAGVDLSAAMIARTRSEVAGHALSNVEVQVADADAPPFPDGSFDVVTAGCMVFLLPDLPAALGRWRALLRANGRLGMSWPVGDDERFTPAFRALAAAAATGSGSGARPPGAAPGSAGLLDSPESFAATLDRSGFHGVETVSVKHRISYESPLHWWTVNWRQAPPATWAGLSEGERDAVRAEVLALLEPLREPADGSLRREMEIRYVSAVAG